MVWGKRGCSLSVSMQLMLRIDTFLNGDEPVQLHLVGEGIPN